MIETFAALLYTRLVEKFLYNSRLQCKLNFDLRPGDIVLCRFEALPTISGTISNDATGSNNKANKKEGTKKINVRKLVIQSSLFYLDFFLM